MGGYLRLDKESGKIIAAAEQFYRSRQLQMDEATFPGSIAFMDEATTCLLGELWKKIEKEGGSGTGSEYISRLDDYGEIAGQYVWMQYEQWALFKAALGKNILDQFFLLGVASCYCASAELQMKNETINYPGIKGMMPKLAGDFINKQATGTELEKYVRSIEVSSLILDLVTCFEDRRMIIYNELGIA